MKMKIDHILSLGTFNPKTERTEPKLNRSVDFSVLQFNFCFYTYKVRLRFLGPENRTPEGTDPHQKQRAEHNISLLSRYWQPNGLIWPKTNTNTYPHFLNWSAQHARKPNLI